MASLPTKAAGFTLLELMFSILIAATIAALSLPTIAKVYLDNEYGKATEDVYDIARFAQLQAGMRGKAYGLFVTTHSSGDNGSITAAECQDTSCCTRQNFDDGDAKAIYTLSLSDGYSSVLILNVSPEIFLDNGICFKPDGRVLNPTNNQIAPSSIPGIGAGTVLIQLQQLSPMGSGNTMINPISHRIEVGGNGDIFIDYGN
jgi:prepilin-type N-terminal cleavage/methylation domain-containing protein